MQEYFFSFCVCSENIGVRKLGSEHSDDRFYKKNEANKKKNPILKREPKRRVEDNEERR